MIIITKMKQVASYWVDVIATVMQLHSDITTAMVSRKFSS